jgi:hypothetical protein
MNHTSIFARLLALTVLLFIGTSFQNKASAQFQTQNVSVDISEDLFNAMADRGAVIELKNLGSGSFRAINIGNPTPVDPAPCAEQMTAAYAAYMLSLANACCCPVYTCVQGSNCAWYLYMFRPDDPNCLYSVSYSSTLTAYAY